MRKIHKEIIKVLGAKITQDARGFICDDIVIYPNFEEVLEYMVIKAKTPINLPCVLGYAITIQMNSFDFIECNPDENSDNFQHDSIKEGLTAFELVVALDAQFPNIADCPCVLEAQR